MGNFLSCPKFIMCEGKGDFIPFDNTKEKKKEKNKQVECGLVDLAPTFTIACPNF